MLLQQEVLNLGVMQKGLVDGYMDLWCNCLVFPKETAVAESHSSRMEHVDEVLSVWEDLNNVSHPIPFLVLPLNNDISP